LRLIPHDGGQLIRDWVTDPTLKFEHCLTSSEGSLRERCVLLNAICSECEANRTLWYGISHETGVHIPISLTLERSTMVLDRTKGYRRSLGYSSSVLKANTVVRKLRSGLQSVLVRASDGFPYWVKLLDGLQGPNTLANEVLGNELTRYLGISVPNWSPIEFSKDFLDSNPLCWPEPGSGLPRPSPGMYFASRALEQDLGETAYEILPGNWLNRISNRDDFVGMLALDVWANQVGNRRAVFVPSADRSLITVAFIENSQMFGGFWGNGEQRPGTALYLDQRVYANLNLREACHRWLRKIAVIDEALLLHLGRFIPGEWMAHGALEQIVTKLQIRQRRLEHLLAQELRLIDETGDQSVPRIMAIENLPELSVGQILDGWKPESHFRQRHRRHLVRRNTSLNLY
jgi:hypothetical protein